MLVSIGIEEAGNQILFQYGMKELKTEQTPRPIPFLLIILLMHDGNFILSILLHELFPFRTLEESLLHSEDLGNIIKSLKQRWETYCFAPFLILIVGTIF